MSRVCVFAIAALALAGCGGGSDTKRELKVVEISTGPLFHPDENGGTVTGKVAFTGDKPTVKMLDMSATPFCTRTHPNGTPSEEIVVNKNGTVKNAFVWIKAGLATGRWEAPQT